MKIYQYQTVVISDRGHLTDPEFLAALNDNGILSGPVICPFCGATDHAIANGWKHKEEQPKGGHELAVLMEREIEVECPSRNHRLLPNTV